MTGLNADESDFIAKAFGDDRDSNLPNRLADLSNKSGRNIQSGFRFILMGAVVGIRNLEAQNSLSAVSDQEVFEERSPDSRLMHRWMTCPSDDVVPRGGIS